MNFCYENACISFCSNTGRVVSIGETQETFSHASLHGKLIRYFIPRMNLQNKFMRFGHFQFVQYVAQDVPPH